MPDEFSFITESDKNKLSYGTCVGGMAMGQWVDLQGLLIDGITGTAYGLMCCKILQEPIT